MKSFLAGTDVTLHVPLVDASGNALQADSIQFRVTDQNGKEILPLSPLSSFVKGASEAVVVVSATSNTLANQGVSTIDLRAVELHCSISGNTTILKDGYAISLADPLVVGVNSFQTYAQAQFHAATLVPNIPSWDASTEGQRTTALIEARTRINQLAFTQLNTNVIWSQDSLHFVPEGSYAVSHVTNSGMWLFNGDLGLLTPDQFSKLPQKFLMALYKAQIAEADNILSGDSVEARRRSGLLLETIGEVKQMYRSGKPLEMPVCKRAMSYLSYFISNTKRIARR